ncbi:MAG: guanylyltransferase [Oscillospiraceae bacterium]|nr:guanylyltransferase [Oscillospiraceae bacterium]
MNFDDLDKKMRVYEQSIDQLILADMFMVARLDGRSFSRLTKEICDFEAPFDVRFRDMMTNTVRALMDCGFRVVYGFTESDEISLLFHKEENTFGRKVRKYNSILAGIASAAFSLQLGQVVALDCRIVPLPNIERVQDYFLWRQEDAHRNALNAHCYWLLRKEGMDANQATAELEGKSVSYKNELLFSRGINFDKLPSWQKRGIGVYWADIEKIGFNPITKTEEKTIRRKLQIDTQLPLGEAYGKMVSSFLD